MGRRQIRIKKINVELKSDIIMESHTDFDWGSVVCIRDVAECKLVYGYGWYIHLGRYWEGTV